MNMDGFLGINIIVTVLEIASPLAPLGLAMTEESNLWNLVSYS